MSFNGIGVPLPRIEFAVGWEDESGFDNARLEYPAASGWREYTTVFHKKTVTGTARIRIYYRWKIQ